MKYTYFDIENDEYTGHKPMIVLYDSNDNVIKKLPIGKTEVIGLLESLGYEQDDTFEMNTEDNHPKQLSLFGDDSK